MGTKPVKRKGRKNRSNEELAKAKLLVHKSLLTTGRVLCIDPSCASKSSMPGWAKFEGGKLVAAGTLDIPSKFEHRVRLRLILEDLQSFIPDTDIVLIEEIPVRPIRTKLDAKSTGKTWMSAKSHGSLVEAIGATKAAFPASMPVLKLPASLWSRISREKGWGMCGSTVMKSDSMDAVRIGMAALSLLGITFGGMQDV